MLAGQHIGTDHFASPLDGFVHLRRESVAIVFQPAGVVEAESGQKSGGSAVAVDKRVNVNELELCEPGHEYGRDIGLRIQPCDKLSHEFGNIVCRRRGVDDPTGFSVGNEVLDAAIFAGPCFSAADTDDQQAVDFAVESFGDGAVAENVPGDQLEGFSVVEQFKAVISEDAMHLLTCEQFFGLFEGELGAFDVCGVVGFKQERALTHAAHPLFGQCSSLQESSSAFGGCQIAGDGVGD